MSEWFGKVGAESVDCPGTCTAMGAVVGAGIGALLTLVILETYKSRGRARDYVRARLPTRYA